MTTPRRIVLTLGPELYARLEARSAEGRLDAREWALRALLACLRADPHRLTALTRSESKALSGSDRDTRQIGLAGVAVLVLYRP